MIPTTRSDDADSIPVDGDRFEILWLQIEDEAGFSAGQISGERDKLHEDIAILETRIAEKKEELAAIERRVQAAQNQLRALLTARLSDDAILSAMRVEYRVKRSVGRPRKEFDAPSPADEDKQFVLDHLDSDGLTVPELKKLTKKDLRFLRTTLESLVDEGKVIKIGENAGAKFHLP